MPVPARPTVHAVAQHRCRCRCRYCGEQRLIHAGLRCAPRGGTLIPMPSCAAGRPLSAPEGCSRDAGRWNPQGLLSRDRRLLTAAHPPSRRKYTYGTVLALLMAVTASLGYLTGVYRCAGNLHIRLRNPFASSSPSDSQTQRSCACEHALACRRCRGRSNAPRGARAQLSPLPIPLHTRTTAFAGPCGPGSGVDPDLIQILTQRRTINAFPVLCRSLRLEASAACAWLRARSLRQAVLLASRICASAGDGHAERRCQRCSASLRAAGCRGGGGGGGGGGGRATPRPAS